jgi:O-antigen/teichoic acid export membrane protein
VPFVLAMQFLQSVLLGQSRTLPYNLLEMATALAGLAALLIVEAVRGLTVDAALAITAGSYVFGAVVMLLCLLDTKPRLLHPDVSLMRRMAGYAAKVYVAGLIAFAVVRIDLLLVNALLGADEAGLYSLAVALKDMIYIMPLIVAMNMFPRVAGGATSSDASAEVFRSVAALYLIVCVVTAIAAPPIVTLLYGDAFADAAGLFRWLAPGAFAVGALNIVTYHFAARGYPMEMVVIWAIGLVLNLAINIAFLDEHGTYIASLSASITYVFIFVLHLRMFARELGGYGPLVPRPGEVVRFVRTALSRG